MVNTKVHFFKIKNTYRVDKDVTELLRHLEDGQLTAFVAKYASRHEPFKKDLLKYFNSEKF